MPRIYSNWKKLLQYFCLRCCTLVTTSTPNSNTSAPHALPFSTVSTSIARKIRYSKPVSIQQLIIYGSKGNVLVETSKALVVVCVREQSISFIVEFEGLVILFLSNCDVISFAISVQNRAHLNENFVTNHN